MVGIASVVIASGCVGWVTLRGPVSGACSPATVEFTGSIGHAVFFADESGNGRKQLCLSRFSSSNWSIA